MCVYIIATGIGCAKREQSQAPIRRHGCMATPVRQQAHMSHTPAPPLQLALAADEEQPQIYYLKKKNNRKLSSNATSRAQRSSHKFIIFF